MSFNVPESLKKDQTLNVIHMDADLPAEKYLRDAVSQIMELGYDYITSMQYGVRVLYVLTTRDDVDRPPVAMAFFKTGFFKYTGLMAIDPSEQTLHNIVHTIADDDSYETSYKNGIWYYSDEASNDMPIEYKVMLSNETTKVSPTTNIEAIDVELRSLGFASYADIDFDARFKKTDHDDAVLLAVHLNEILSQETIYYRRAIPGMPMVLTIDMFGYVSHYYGYPPTPIRAGRYSTVSDAVISHEHLLYTVLLELGCKELVGLRNNYNTISVRLNDDDSWSAGLSGNVVLGVKQSEWFKCIDDNTIDIIACVAGSEGAEIYLERRYRTVLEDGSLGGYQKVFARRITLQELIATYRRTSFMSQRLKTLFGK